MIGRTLIVLAAMACSSCGVIRPPYGGDQELALATATLAADVAAVTRLLQSRANPNGMVDVHGRKQSPWFLALDQIRPDRSVTIEIVKAMLKAGASPNIAWGTNVSDVRRPPESRWRKFLSGSRAEGTGSWDPIWIAMMHPVPDVVRALVVAGLDPRQGEAALVSAVEAEEIGIVRLLVDAGVNINCQPGARTPLLAAVEARNVPLMTYLEEHGAREKP